jgi:predicted transcriptional regulator
VINLSIKRFKYNEEGLSRFFGPLEAKIMDLFWESEQEEFSIKEMQKALETEKNSNFNTVMTVMNRLVEKNVLKKRVSGRVSLFSPIQSKEEFFDEQSKKLTENLLDEFGGVVISHMIDSLTDVDDSLLHKLEEKIQQLKKDKP